MASVAAVLLSLTMAVSPTSTVAGGGPAAALVRVRGRTSIVFSGVVGGPSVTIARTAPTGITVAGRRHAACVAVHLTAPAPKTAGVAAVTIECPAPDRFSARIDLLEPARVSIRPSGDLLYIDLTPEPVRVDAPSDRPPVARHNTPPHAIGSDADVADWVYARATALAQRGDVLGVQALIAKAGGRSSIAPSEEREPRLRRLLDQARRRRLELDRAMFEAAGRKR